MPLIYFNIKDLFALHGYCLKSNSCCVQQCAGVFVTPLAVLVRNNAVLITVHGVDCWFVKKGVQIRIDQEREKSIKLRPTFQKYLVAGWTKHRYIIWLLHHFSLASAVQNQNKRPISKQVSVRLCEGYGNYRLLN